MSTKARKPLFTEVETSEGRLAWCELHAMWHKWSLKPCGNGMAYGYCGYLHDLAKGHMGTESGSEDEEPELKVVGRVGK